jgi:hypothetical protein
MVCKSRSNVYKCDTVTVLGFDILGDISFAEAWHIVLQCSSVLEYQRSTGITCLKEGKVSERDKYYIKRFIIRTLHLVL